MITYNDAVQALCDMYTADELKLLWLAAYRIYLDFGNYQVLSSLYKEAYRYKLLNN